MKNLKVGRKFIVSFGIILALFLVSVVTASMGITRAKKSYQEFYVEDYKAVTSVYEIRVRLQGALKELMLGVMSESAQETSEHFGKVDQYLETINSQLDWIYSNYEGDVSLLKDFETRMENNKGTRMRIIEAASSGTQEGNHQAEEIVINEYNPQVDEYTAILTDAFAQMEQGISDSYESAMMLLNLIIGVSVAIAVGAFVFTVIIALSLTKNIMVPLQKIEEAIVEMVKGNLSVRVEYDSQDEFGDMARNVCQMTSSVSRIIQDIKGILSAMAEGDFTVHSTASQLYTGDYETIFHSMKQIKESFNHTLATLNQSADQVSSGSEQVSGGAQALSQGATEQASSVEELAASINEISSNINRNAQGAQEASSKSMEVGQEAGESNRRMNDMLEAMSEISVSSGEIGKIIKTIEDIAFQTNILALNAAVEAARAGAAGKGFAVVADEVRNLASKSAEASKNTAALIENSLKAVENGKKIADETALSLQSVMAGIQDAAGMMDSIAKASAEQAEGITQITVGIDQISSVVQTNSATAQESAAASEELSGQAQILKDLVRKFRLEGQASPVRAQPAPVRKGASYDGPEGMEPSYYGGNDKY